MSNRYTTGESYSWSELYPLKTSFPLDANYAAIKPWAGNPLLLYRLNGGPPQILCLRFRHYLPLWESIFHQTVNGIIAYEINVSQFLLNHTIDFARSCRLSWLMSVNQQKCNGNNVWSKSSHKPSNDVIPKHVMNWFTTYLSLVFFVN